MRSNILFLHQHTIDEQRLSQQLLNDDCRLSVSRLRDIDDLEELLMHEQIDLFVIKAEDDELILYARQLLSLHKNSEFPVLYMMETDNSALRLELKDLAATHIIYGEQSTENLASIISLIVKKDRYKKQLNTMGGYIKEAIVVCEKDDDGDFIFKHINKAFLELEEIKSEKVIGKKVKENHLVFGLKNLIEDMDEVYNTETPVRLPNYFYIKDGQREWCDVYICTSNPGQISIISSNLSEVKRAHDKSMQSNRYLQTILNAQRHIIYITDGIKLISTNRAFLDFFECETMHQFIKEHKKVCNIFEEASEPFYIDTNEPGWHKKVFENKDERYKIRIKHKDVVKVFVPSVEIIIVDEKEQYVVILSDITELESEKEKLRVLAMTDPLTGVSNRLKFNSMIDNFVEVAKRYDAPLSIIMFDVDHFKQINDKHSHQVGDVTLKQLVRIVSKNVRKADLFVRWGGEEFLIVLSNTTLKNAEIAAEKFRKNIEKEVFADVESITCSFGLSEMSKGDSISDLISRADEAMYQAKHAGRNCIRALEKL